MAQPARKHTKLHVAVIGKKWQRVDRLLNEEPGLLKIQDEYGLTASHYAAWRAPDNIMLKMIATATTDTLNLLTDGVGRSLFHELAYCGRDTAIPHVLGKSPLRINQQTKDGNTPLHWCMSADLPYGDHLTTVKALLQGGADVNIKNKRGNTPGDVYTQNKCSKYVKKERQQHKDEVLQILQRMSFPVEILARGSAAMKAFREAMEEGRVEVNQGRVMVLGQERVGKTCMIDSFLGKEFNANQKITNGIATTTICSKDAADPRKWNEKPGNRKGAVELYDTVLADAIAIEVLVAQEVPNANENTTDQVSQSPDIDGEKPKELTTSAIEEQPSLCEEEPPTNEPTRKEDSNPTPESEELPKHIMKRVRYRLTEGVKLEKHLTGVHKAEDSTINIWDYGGQLVYHGIHRIFLVSRAVYCVVFNLKYNLDEPAIVQDPTTNKSYRYHLTCLEFILYWINSVYTNIRELREDDTYGLTLPAVLLVGTHRDSLSTDETQRKLMVKEIFDRIREAIAGQDYETLVFPKFFDIENSLTLESNILPLKKQILEFCKGMVKIIPLKWLDFQNRIQELMEDHLTLPIEKVNALADNCGIKDEFKSTLFNYFCDLGVIVHFADHDILKEIVVIDPMGLVGILKAVITVIEPEFQTAMQRRSWRKLDEGVLEERLLRYLWKKAGINLEEDLDYLVALMQKFGLICECKSLKTSGRSFFVPMRLKPRLPDEMHSLKYHNHGVSLYLDFSGYFPDDLSHHLFVRVIDRFQVEDAEEPKLSHDQVVLHLDEFCLLSLARVTVKNRRMLQMTIAPRIILNERGDRKEYELSPVTCTKVLDGIMEELRTMRDGWRRGISWEVCIPCVACECQSDLHLHALKKCLHKSVLACGSRGMETARFKRLFGHKTTVKDLSAECVVPNQHIEGYVDDGIVSTISEALRIDWKRFGVRLGLTWSKLKLIEADHGPTKMAVVNMMEYWRNNIDSDRHQLKDLCVALRVHNPRLAESLHPEDLPEITQQQNLRDSERVCFEDQDLLFVCDKLRVSEWRQFCVRLEMNWNEISEVAANNRHVRDSIMECLVMWRDRLKSNHRLIMTNALRKQNLVELADDVCERICPGETIGHQSRDQERQQFGKTTGGYMQDIDLLFIAEKLDRKWKDFARYLGLDDPELSHIEAQFSHVDAILEALVRWRDKQGRHSHHLELIIEALTKHQRKDIVLAIELAIELAST